MNIEIENQRLRTLTTKILHTNIKHVYEDIEAITMEEGIMTHHIPLALEALNPFLLNKVKDSKFWNNELDLTHGCSTELEVMNEKEKEEFFKLFQAELFNFYNSLSDNRNDSDD